MKKLTADDFVLLDDFVTRHPLRVDTVYAKAAHKDNMFKSAIYREDAPMAAHRDLAAIILRAADICFAETGYYFECKDCLRPLEAQQKIIDSAIVRAHPQWLEEPRLFSPPGKGGHPRGMAVDIVLIDQNGEGLDMGTPFDYLTTDKSINPAARDFTDWGRGAAGNAAIIANRAILTNAMLRAAAERDRVLVPLPQEWWDFRFPNEETAQFEPVRDADMPMWLQMM